MKIKLYTFQKKDMELFGDALPEYVYENIGKNSYFTLGAVGEEEEQAILLGMVQFHSNVTRKGQYFVEVVYIYVMEEFRRNGVGSKMMDRVTRITKKSDVDNLTLLLPAEEGTEPVMDMPVKGMEEFLEVLGFTKTDVNLNLFESVLKENNPELKEEAVERYTKLLKL